MESWACIYPAPRSLRPHTPLRDALTRAATTRRRGAHRRSAGATGRSRRVDEAAIRERDRGLLATGGSTNHTIHWSRWRGRPACRINWDDFGDLSDVVPLLARIYPNGSADINHFHAAGGWGF